MWLGWGLWDLFDSEIKRSLGLIKEDWYCCGILIVESGSRGTDSGGGRSFYTGWFLKSL